jgi:hypothetical protein
MIKTLQENFMATYSLQVKNDSPNPGAVCLYTTSPDTQEIQQNLRSLAWFSKPMNKGTQAKFTWNLDFSFAWAESSELVPGVSFEAGQIIAADIQDKTKNRAFFSRENNAYEFGDPANAVVPPAGALVISTDGSIPYARALIGIGINGRAALVVNATPNYNFTFIPKIKYWLAFGNFKEGTVLDLNSMVLACEIAYPLNEYNMQVNLKEDNMWGPVVPV